MSPATTADSVVTDADFDLDRMFPTPPAVPRDTYATSAGGQRRSGPRGRSKVGPLGRNHFSEVAISERGNRPVQPSRKSKRPTTWG